ncbi:MAG TPA: hypothetical protein VIK59_09935 [Verrucomicrobiae bacterium]
MVISLREMVKSDGELVNSRREMVKSVANFDRYLAICWGFAIKGNSWPALKAVLDADSRKETPIPQTGQNT